MRKDVWHKDTLPSLFCKYKSDKLFLLVGWYTESNPNELLQHRPGSADLPPLSQSSPLGGSVGVQHAASLHPAPDSVHASQRLLFQAAAASLDALLDPKH